MCVKLSVTSVHMEMIVRIGTWPRKLRRCKYDGTPDCLLALDLLGASNISFVTSGPRRLGDTFIGPRWPKGRARIYLHSTPHWWHRLRKYDT